MKILVIDDDPTIHKILQVGLQNEGCLIDCAVEGRQGLKMAVAAPYDGIIMDLMLPEKCGDEICQRLRAAQISTPIVALTAVTDLQSKVRMLNLGADDYLTKPFEFEELFARLKNLIRKHQIPTEEIITYSDIELDRKKHQVRKYGNPVVLRDKELRILEYLLLHPEQVLTREMILNYVWGPNTERYTNVVDVHIHHLRDKLDRPYGTNVLKTVNNVGYKLSAA